MFLIRNFGADTDCHDVGEVIKNIQKYQGISVAIQDKRPNGRLFFVDVGQDGVVTESYGKKRVVDLELMLKVPGEPQFPDGVPA